MKLQDSVRAARRCGTPLIIIRTADPAQTMRGIQVALKPKKDAPEVPMLAWDIVVGAIGLNDPGTAALEKMLKDTSMEPSSTTNPTEFCNAAKKLVKDSLVFMMNLHRFTDDIGLVQALWNLRDKFKENSRTVIGLVPSIALPAELQQDVLVLDEPLPTDKDLTEIAKEIYASAKLKDPEPAVVERIVDATLGLAAFPAEQSMAMSITKNGMDMEELWERKRKLIGQAPGLSVVPADVTFADIGGIKNAKTFMQRVIGSSEPPRCFVFIDEGEKAFAGSSVGGGDSSGVSQNFLGTLLSTMQDEKYRGIIGVGFPGSAKSMLAKSVGATAGVPTIQFDLAGMKSSLVGSSEENLRRALATVKAVSQGRAYFIMTCNGIATLPPELKRRFRDAIFFFEIPDEEEKSVIWNLYLAKYKAQLEGIDTELPNDTHWTGSEISTCVDNAARFGISLRESATYIVPAFDSMGTQKTEQLRAEADGRYISASYPGPYRKNRSELIATAPSGGRKLDLEE